MEKDQPNAHKDPKGNMEAINMFDLMIMSLVASAYIWLNVYYFLVNFYPSA
jgi:hypothetical protein